MTKFLSLITALIIPFAVINHAGADAVIDPALQNFISGQSLEKRTQVIAMLEVPENNLQRPHRYDRQQVLAYLHGLMGVATRSLQMSAVSAGLTAADIQIREVFWINLSISAIVTPDGVRMLSKTPGVAAIYSNKKIIYPRPATTVPDNVNTMPRHYAQTGLDKVIQEMPELDGRGILIGHIDTGVDGSHPALAGKVALFFDGTKIAPPSDADSHGTHTAGTILGGNRKDNFIGVAPAAKLVSAGFLRTLDEVLRGMQWMLDPDGNPQTNDMPRLVSNSWRVWHDSTLDVQPLYRAVSSWEAAGILPVFAAGNEGPRERTLGHPSQHPNTVCVAATGPDDTPASFSSRGPGTYEGKPVEKPDIAAPGVDIISSLPGNRYGKLSGTSMATPQVAGAVALILQMNQRLTPPQIREVLKASATPTAGASLRAAWNPVLGFGRINIHKAVKLVQSFTQNPNVHVVNPLTAMFNLRIGETLPAPSIEDQLFTME